MPSNKYEIRNSSDQSVDDRSERFEAIYRKYFDKLYGYARAICSSQSMAKDVVSDFFYHLWKNETDLSKIENLEIYLLVSVKNRATHALAHEKKLSTTGDNVDVLLETIEFINPEELLLEKELKHLLDAKINDLPDQGQLIFRMAREQGLKQAEIARELGISITTVKSQLKRAQTKLRAEIIRYYMDAESDTYPNIRLIGQVIFLMGLLSYEILN